jgi:hypothetical protein
MHKFAKYIVELFIVWSISMVIILLFSLLMNLGLIFGIGIYIALFSWWGWPLRTFELSNLSYTLYALIIPIAFSIIIRLILENIVKKSWVNLYISIIAYYIIGTIYYFIFPYIKPDVDIIIAFFIWIPCLIMSCFIVQKILKFYRY